MVIPRRFLPLLLGVYLLELTFVSWYLHSLQVDLGSSPHVPGPGDFLTSSKMALAALEDAVAHSLETHAEAVARIRPDAWIVKQPPLKIGQEPSNDNLVAEEGLNVEPPAQGIDSSDEQNYRVAGLSCARHGGPDDATAAEMVYWRDIPSDAKYVSPLRSPDTEQYLVFEHDDGGWNNVRMAMETSVMIAIATGRTLVLPPKLHLGQMEGGVELDRFYHFKSLEAEHVGVKVITLEEFLEKEAMAGKLVSPLTGEVAWPPYNRTNWEHWRGHKSDYKELWNWMRNATTTLPWNRDKCFAGFPSARGPSELVRMNETVQEIINETQQKHKNDENAWAWRVQSFNGYPTPVDAPMKDRMAEILADLKGICLYDESLQNAKVLHLEGDEASGHRLLIHFYAFLFFQSFEQDLWVKRFVRDHLRYNDELQCAAARIVAAIRAISRERGDPTGSFDTFHIRRSDFQNLPTFQEMAMPAEAIYFQNSKGIIPENRTVFIATDEKNNSYFDPLREHYHCLFLNDFKKELNDLPPSMYGMVDQLVASKGDVFFGVYYSTFTGYINRLRGYHSQKQKLPGYEQGMINSYYYTTEQHASLRNIMREYQSISKTSWAREYPVAWRDIDHTVPAR